MIHQTEDKDYHILVEKNLIILINKMIIMELLNLKLNHFYIQIHKI